MGEGRARFDKAAKKQAKAKERWTPPTAIDNSWMKFVRCDVCDQRMCVNNYHDRKVRVPRFQGRPICPWCSGRARGGRRTIRCMNLIQRLANAETHHDLTELMDEAREEVERWKEHRQKWKDRDARRRSS